MQQSFSTQNKGSIFFLASGIALAAVLIGGRRFGWAIFVGAWLASLLTGKAFWASAIQAGGATLGALFGAWLLRRNPRFDDQLRTLSDFLQLLVFGGFVSASVSAMLGSSTFLLQGFVSSSEFWACVLDWWMGDVQGVLLLTPFILLWRPQASAPYQRPSLLFLGESALAFAGIILGAGIIFLEWARHLPTYPNLIADSAAKAYWMFLCIAWVALRLGLRATSLALLLIAGIAVTGLYQGVGFFRHDGANGLTSYWFYTLCLSVVGMALAAYIEANKRLTRALALKTQHLEQALLDLHATEEKQRLLLEESSDPIFCFTPDIRYSYANAAFATPVGKTPQEVIGSTPHDIFPKDEADKRVSGVRSIFELKQERTFEVRVPGAAGDRFYLTTVKPLFNAQLQVTTVLGISKEITQRKLAEANLVKTLSLLSATLEASSEGIIVVDLTGKFERWNQQFVELWHIDENMLQGQHQAQVRSYMADLMLDPLAYLQGIHELRETPEKSSLDQLKLTDGRILRRTTHPQKIDNVVVGRVTSFADITETEQQKEALRQSETRFTLAVEGADEGIWDLDLLTGDLYHSPRMAEMLGYTLTELPSVRATWDALAHPNDIPCYMAKMVAHFKDPDQAFETIVRLRHKDGTWRSILSRGRASRNPTGRAIRFTGTHTDITERIRIEEAAQSANRAKSEFLAVMSHEIRTPMNGVVGMVDVLLHSDLPAEPQRMLGVVRDSSVALLNILNDILDYSKIEANKLELEHIPTPLHQLAQNVIQLMLPNAIAKAVELKLAIAPNLPTWVYADPSRLRQVLFNLIGNAIKFTPSTPERPGEVVLQIETAMAATQQAILQLRVIDNGIGMTDDVMEVVFAPFTQADSSTARQFGGTGLGLSICQRLVELMGGEISVFSQPGQGSQFTIELPLQLASEHTAPVDPTDQELRPKRQTPSHTHASASAQLVLLAEDDETNRDVMLEQLRLLGYSADVANDGRAALAMWRSKPYALLLTDCHMPGLDGFALASTIRKEEPAGTRMPIIAVTANALKGEAERCIDSGMDDFLTKPLRLNKLAPVLNKWLPNPASTQSDRSVP